MKPRLTEDEVNHRLKPYGLALVGPWHGTDNKNTFRCAGGHIWSANATNVLYGHTGCPECSRIRHSTAAINARLAPRGLRVVGRWLGMNTVNQFACSNGHTWRVRGQKVAGIGTGCPHCTGPVIRRLPTWQVRERLAPRGIALVGEWQGTKKENRFLCILGHQWSTSGHSVLTKGTGCPECAHLANINHLRRLNGLHA